MGKYVQGNNSIEGTSPLAYNPLNELDLSEPKLQKYA